MDVGKFTQIRPTQSENTLELVKTHFPLKMPLHPEQFLQKFGELAFDQIRVAAKEYLNESGTLNRASEFLKFLDGEKETISEQHVGNINIPSNSILRFAYALSWTPFSEMFVEEEQDDDDRETANKKKNAKSKTAKLREPVAGLTGNDITKADIANLQFSDDLSNDLIALYLVPGMLPEYRRFLSMLFKVVDLLKGCESGEEIFAEEAVVLANGPTRLYRLKYGKILLPAIIHADDPPGIKSPVITNDAIDPLLAGNEQVQASDHLSLEPFSPNIFRPKPIPGFGVVLTKPGEEYPKPKQIDAVVQQDIRRTVLVDEKPTKAEKKNSKKAKKAEMGKTK